MSSGLILKMATWLCEIDPPRSGRTWYRSQSQVQGSRQISWGLGQCQQRIEHQKQVNKDHLSTYYVPNTKLGAGPSNITFHTLKDTFMSVLGMRLKEKTVKELVNLARN